MAELKIKSGPEAGRVHQVGDRLTIGRLASNTVCIDDVMVSRNHAEIYGSGDEYFVRDLGSRNGTMVNDRLVSEKRLEAGDLITIGPVAMQFTGVKPRDLVGQTIGGCRVLERIGGGGMGTIYKVQQISMDRVVALKVLSASLVTDQNFVKQFVREARWAGQLNHPNIIHVHDVGADDETYYFSMEYVDGVTVQHLLDRHEPIPVKRALDIIIGVAEALDYAHRRSIIHGDIKPQNIMITPVGDVKLADLGLARDPRGGLDLAVEDESGRRRVWGTPRYMAPEQAKALPTDVRSDIYALGATLYHMLAGRPPFVGKSGAEILRKHVREPLVPLEAVNPLVPAALAAIVERMMAKAPEDRYQTMTDVLKDLVASRNTIAGVKRPEEVAASLFDADIEVDTTQESPGAGSKLRAVGAAVLIAVSVLLALYLVFKALE